MCRYIDKSVAEWFFMWVLPVRHLNSKTICTDKNIGSNNIIL